MTDINGLAVVTGASRGIGAAALVKGVQRNAREVVSPFMMKQIYIQHALAPRVVEWLNRATGYRRPA